MSVLPCNGPACEGGSKICRCIQLIAIRTASQINSTSGTAQSNCILGRNPFCFGARNCGDLHSIGTRNAEKLPVLINVHPGAFQRHCCCRIAHFQSSLGTVAQQRTASTGDHIGAAPIFRGGLEFIKVRRRPLRRSKILIQRIKCDILTIQRIAFSSFDIIRRLSRCLHRHLRPAHEMVFLQCAFRCSLRFRQNHRIAHIRFLIRLCNAIRYAEVNCPGRFSREVNCNGTILPHSGYAENIAILLYRSSALRSNRIARRIVAFCRFCGNRCPACLNRVPIIVRIGLSRQIVLVHQRPGRVDRLLCVNFSMARIRILCGNHDWKSRFFPKRLLISFRSIAGRHIIRRNDLARIIPLSASILHITDGSGHIIACQQAVEERFLECVIANKGNGLAISINSPQPLLHQRRFQAVSRHAQTDSHPQQAIVCIALHVVCNDRAIHLIVFHLAASAAIDSMAVLIIVFCQPLTALKAEIGGLCFRCVIIVAIVIIGRAVAVENNDAAILDRIRNGVYRCSCGLIIMVCAVSGCGNTLRFRLILPRKGSVQAKIRLE